jgi:hypothetical protein
MFGWVRRCRDHRDEYHYDGVVGDGDWRSYVSARGIGVLGSISGRLSH